MQPHDIKIDKPEAVGTGSGRGTLAETLRAFSQATLNGVDELHIEALGYARVAIADGIEVGRAIVDARTARELVDAQRRFACERVRASADLACTLVDIAMNIGGETGAPLIQAVRRTIEGLRHHGDR